MHAVHKILARASGKKEVFPGEIITAKLDIVGITDVYPIVIKTFKEMLGDKVWDREKVFVFLDHDTPASNLNVALSHKLFRTFVREQKCHFFDVNEGISHLLLAEKGLIKPGSMIVITDSHTPIHGAFGSFAIGLGATDVAAILIEGSTWISVPHVINIRLSGHIPENVMAKDIALNILGRLGSNFANYRVIEFSGPVVESMSLEERMVLTCMATEMGAKSAFIKPDAKVSQRVKTFLNEEFLRKYESDGNFQYEAEYEFDVTNLNPQVALPHSVENVSEVNKVEGLKIDQVFVGSCTGGKITDIEVVAKVLKGKKVAKDTRLIVTMGTKEVVKESIQKGYYQVLIDAGACITSPGCGACSGLLGGVLAPQEKCASTANRNFPGRMGGSTEAEIYLVSPLTAAFTALTGYLTNPPKG